MMKRWLAVMVVFAVTTGAVWYNLPEKVKPVGEGDAVLAFKLPDLQNQLAGLPEGKVVLLNFWATWCPPCRQEIPSMAALQQRFAGTDLKVVAVSVDRNRDDLMAFVREHDMPFKVLHDADASVSQQYGVFKYPETFLIGRDGKVRYHLIGAIDWMAPEVIQGIEGMLGEPGQDTPG